MLANLLNKKIILGLIVGLLLVPSHFSLAIESPINIDDCAIVTDNQNTTTEQRIATINQNIEKENKKLNELTNFILQSKDPKIDPNTLAINKSEYGTDAQSAISLIIFNYNSIHQGASGPGAVPYIADTTKAYQLLQVETNNIVATIKQLNQNILKEKACKLKVEAEDARENGNEDIALQKEEEIKRLLGQSIQIAIDSKPLYQQNYDILDGIRAEDSTRVCTSLWRFNLDACIANGLDVFFGIIIWLYNWLLYIVNEIFNFAITKTILEFNDLVKDLGIVDFGWTLSRDLANMFFIFILLYTAIGTILQLSKVDAKDTIVKIIILALIINFSATFTKIAIDASNITATTFYQLIGDGEKTPNISNIIQKSISFLQSKDVDKDKTSPYKDGTPTASLNQKTSSASLQALVKNIGLLILMTITIFTLIAGSILFLIRGIALMIIIITAPLAFLGYIFSPLKEVFTMWFNRLKSDILFAPVFMFFLYVTFAITDQIYSGAGVFADNQKTVTGEIFIFFILNGFLLGSLIVAQKVGVSTYGFDEKWIKGKSKAVGGLVGRETLGRWSQNTLKDKKLQKMLGSKYRPVNMLGRGFSRLAEKGANAGFGGGKEMSYKSSLEAQQKRQKTYFEQAKDPKLQANLLNNLLMERDKQALYKSLNSSERAKLEEASMKDGNTAVATMLKNFRGKLDDDEKKKTDEALADIIKKQIKYESETKINKDTGKEETKLSNTISDLAKQVTKFAKLDTDMQKLVYNNLSDPDKIALEREAIEQTKSSDQETRVTAEKVKNSISKLRDSITKSDKEKEQKLDKAEEEFNSKVKKQDVIELINKVKKIADRQITETPDELNQTFSKLINTLTIKQVSTLPPNVLTQPELAKLFSGKMLESIYKNNEELTDPEYEKILNIVKKDGTESAKVVAYAGIAPVGQGSSKVVLTDRSGTVITPPSSNSNLNNDPNRPDGN